MWLFASLLAIEVVLSVTSSDFNVSPLSRSRRQVMRDPSHRWSTSGPISYYFDGIEPAAQKKIREAFQFWEEHTCLRFRENGQGWPKIRLYPGGKCASDMGMQRGAGIQNMSLGDGCENFGTATHEIAHTLGFHHEHMRYDRDDYLDFDWNNIIASAKKGNFEKQTPLTSENYGVPYDYGSVMHYNAAAFYRDPNKDTIFAKDRLHQETMGQRIKPSFFDVLLMNAHYGCLGGCQNYRTACQNQGFPNPKNCNQCICPWGFGGRLCEIRDPGSNASMPCGADLEATEASSLLSVYIPYKGMTLDRHDHCHWIIKAPTGCRVEIIVKDIGNQCWMGCIDANVELKMKADVRYSGYRMCCADKWTGKTFISETNRAVVSIYARTFQYLTIQYRYV